MSISFFMAMAKVPTCTHQEKQVKVINGKPVFYEPAELKQARSKLRAYLSPYVPEKPFTGPVYLNTIWCFAATGKHLDGDYKITKPDTDNLVKMLKDIMTDLHFWEDDAQVASEMIMKRYSNVPGIYVWVESL